MSNISIKILIRTTLACLIAEQGLISKQGGILLKIVKRAGLIKRAGWNVLIKLISEQGKNFHFLSKNTTTNFYHSSNIRVWS